MRKPMNNPMKSQSPEINSPRLRAALLIAGMLVLTALLLSACSSNAKKEEAAKDKAGSGKKADEHKEAEGNEVSLSPEALTAFQRLTADSGWVLIGMSMYWTDTRGQTWRELTLPDLGAAAGRSAAVLGWGSVGWGSVFKT